jgi:hypothetical protein
MDKTMTNSITINSAALKKACSTPALGVHTPKKSTVIPEWTHIDGLKPNKLTITAPAHTTTLEGTGELKDRFSVNAIDFYLALLRFEKVRKSCTLSLEGNRLSLSFGGTKMTLGSEIGRWIL